MNKHLLDITLNLSAKSVTEAQRDQIKDEALLYIKSMNEPKFTHVLFDETVLDINIRTISDTTCLLSVYSQVSQPNADLLRVEGEKMQQEMENSRQGVSSKMYRLACAALEILVPKDHTIPTQSLASFPEDLLHDALKDGVCLGVIKTFSKESIQSVYLVEEKAFLDTEELEKASKEDLTQDGLGAHVERVTNRKIM